MFISDHKVLSEVLWHAYVVIGRMKKDLLQTQSSSCFSSSALVLFLPSIAALCISNCLARSQMPPSRAFRNIEQNAKYYKQNNTLWIKYVKETNILLLLGLLSFSLCKLHWGAKQHCCGSGPLNLIAAAVTWRLLKFCRLARQLCMLTWLFLGTCNGLQIIAGCGADNRTS